MGAFSLAWAPNDQDSAQPVPKHRLPRLAQLVPKTGGDGSLRLVSEQMNDRLALCMVVA
jgi:hypothetical protein